MHKVRQKTSTFVFNQSVYACCIYIKQKHNNPECSIPNLSHKYSPDDTKQQMHTYSKQCSMYVACMWILSFAEEKKKGK